MAKLFPIRKCTITNTLRQWLETKGMVMRALVHSIFIVMFSLGPETAFAASFQEEYKAFNDAVQKKDYKTAERHAEAAWRAAKKENVDKNTLAVLAYNYGYFVHATNPAAAVAPLKEAFELAGANSQMFGLDTPDLLLANVELSLKPDNQEKYNQLYQLLRSREEAGIKPTAKSAIGWMLVTNRQISRRRLSEAIEFADKAMEHVEASGEKTISLQADAYILAGVARVVDRGRNQKDLTEAFDFFQRAVDLFPPQKSIETMDEKLASALAWGSVTSSVAVTEYNTQPSKRPGGIRGKDAHCPDRNCLREIVWETEHRENAECGYDWSKQKRPIWPRSELNKRAIGAVLMGFHINKNGAVEGARILSEVPGASDFGAAALDAVKQWRVPGVDLSPACTRNRTVAFQFVF